MKKLLALFLVLGLISFGMTSCSGSGKSDEEKAAEMMGDLTEALGDAVSDMEDAAPPVAPEGWETVDKGEFTIAYPAEWLLETDGASGTEFAVFSELEGDADMFQENVNIVSETLPPREVTLEEYSEASRSQLKEAFQGFDLIEEKELSDAYGKYRYIIYHAKLEGFDLAWKQQFRIKDGKAYVLTYSATQEKFDTYKDSADKIFSTFYIK